MLRIGNIVEKNEGYYFEGIIVSVFANIAGQERYVVEHKEWGWLMIFNENQIRLKK